MVSSKLSVMKKVLVYRENAKKLKTKQKYNGKHKRKCVYFFRTNRQNQKAYTEQVNRKNKLYNTQDKQNTKYEL